MIRYKTCGTCKGEFHYEVGRGKDRKHCGDVCRVKHKVKLRKQRLLNLPLCNGPECKNKATRVSYGLCESCYYRLRRNGNTGKREVKGRYVTKAGYVKVLKTDHPLSEKQGLVAEHRMVLYDKYGPGVQVCFWCGASLSWIEVVGDHLNENKQDNDPINLVISCNACNRARGAILPFIDRMITDRFDVFMRSLRSYKCHDIKTQEEGAWGK